MKQRVNIGPLEQRPMRDLSITYFLEADMKQLLILQFLL
jgi:hypothetical protein